MNPDSCKPDLSPFRRANAASELLSFRGSRYLERFVRRQVTHGDPSRVPLSVLRGMDEHPMVYLAERTITGVVRRPDLYYVRHPDAQVRAEVEEWLWPLLPSLLGSIARAYAYGAIPVVFNWGEEDLVADGRPLRGHVHYVSAHELWPGDVTVESRNDRLVALKSGEQRYLAERAALFVWDREFGGWRGKSARRRAWLDYCRSLLVELLHVRYLERSVDSPRVAYVPSGFVEVEGQQVDGFEHVNGLLTELRGSGSLALPNDRDAKGQREYEIDLLNVPDRQGVWERALNRYDAGILRAYLVPPRLGGLDDVGAAGARTLDGMLKEFVQDLAQFAAEQLTEIVSTVHRYNHSEREVAAPEVLAYEVPATVRKLYLEVLRLVSAAQRDEAPADWVDVPALLDQLGVPIRSEPQRSRGRSGGLRGRPRDVTSERQERREQARTERGEDAVGRRTGTEGGVL